MALADRSHLVKKVIEDKNGNHRVVYVNPHTGEHGTEEERMKPRTDALSALKYAIAHKTTLAPEHIAELPKHLRTLTKDQKKAVLKQLGLHISDDKKSLMARLSAYIKGEVQPMRPQGPDSLYKAVKRFGGIDPKSLAFLAHYGKVKDAIEDGVSLGLFRKGGAGLDALAQEMHGSGYISEPTTEHLIDQLRKGAKATYNLAQTHHTDAMHDYYAALHEAEQYAAAHPEDKPALDGAKATAGGTISKEEQAKAFREFMGEPATEKPAEFSPLVRLKDGLPEHGQGSTPQAAEWLHGRAAGDAGIDAVRDYTGNTFATINEALRTGDARDLDKSERKTHDELQRVFLDAPEFDQPIQVRRGLKLRGAALEEFLAQLRGAQLQGTTIEHRGYVSTTSGTDATLFDKGNVILNITAHKGIDVTPVSKEPGENEILLNHASKFRVKGVRQEGDKWIVDMEQALKGR